MEFSSSPLRSRAPLNVRAWLAIPLRFLRFLAAHKVATTVVIVLSVYFYWSQLRPIVIARHCAAQASLDSRQLLKSKAEIAKEKDTRESYMALVKKNMYLRSDYDSFLQKCLLHYGFQIANLQKSAAAASSPTGEKENE